MVIPARTLVWDAPTRVFHWLLATSFALAWLTADGDRWQGAHVMAGYTMAGLVVFRLVWGLVGTRHARFSDFVRGPGAVLAYARSLLQGRPEYHAGHNPAGGLAIVGLLALAGLTAATGWAHYADLAGHWLEELHEGLATGMLALVAVHVLAVIASSFLHRENLVAAMIHGRKPAPAAQGIRRAWPSLGAALLAAVLAFWWFQWPAAGTQPGTTAAEHEDDD